MYFERAFVCFWILVAVIWLSQARTCYQADRYVEFGEYEEAWVHITQKSLVSPYQSVCESANRRLFAAVFSQSGLVRLQLEILEYAKQFRNPSLWNHIFEALGRQDLFSPEDVVEFHRKLNDNELILRHLKHTKYSLHMYYVHFKEYHGRTRDHKPLRELIDNHYIRSLPFDSHFTSKLRDYKNTDSSEIVGSCIDKSYMHNFRGERLLVEVIEHFTFPGTREVALHYALHYEDKVVADWAILKGANVYPHMNSRYLETLTYHPSVAVLMETKEKEEDLIRTQAFISMLLDDDDE